MNDFSFHFIFLNFSAMPTIFAAKKKIKQVKTTDNFFLQKVLLIFKREEIYKRTLKS